jgi:hypothetical protein
MIQHRLPQSGTAMRSRGGADISAIRLGAPTLVQVPLPEGPGNIVRVEVHERHEGQLRIASGHALGVLCEEHVGSVRTCDQPPAGR